MRRRFRTTDPETSAEAAERVEPRVASDYAIILGTLATASAAMTASEIDREHRMQPMHMFLAHKRLPEMERRGLVVRDAVRKCGVTGYKATTWRVRQ
jgi:predicted DNA-binding transcriptional regulator